jgi:hypothetical protein
MHRPGVGKPFSFSLIPVRYGKSRPVVLAKSGGSGRSQDLIEAGVKRRGLARIMHHAALFCTSGELTRADVPSGGIGVRQLGMQRVRG